MTHQEKLEYLARIGYATRAAVYMLVGGVTLMAAARCDGCHPSAPSAF